MEGKIITDTTKVIKAWTYPCLKRVGTDFGGFVVFFHDKRGITTAAGMVVVGDGKSYKTGTYSPDWPLTWGWEDLKPNESIVLTP